MLKKCAILGLVFLLIGAFALRWVFRQMEAERQEVAKAQAAAGLRPEERIAKYGRWAQLTPEEQNALMLELERDMVEMRRHDDARRDSFEVRMRRMEERLRAPQPQPQQQKERRGCLGQFFGS